MGGTQALGASCAGLKMGIIIKKKKEQDKYKGMKGEMGVNVVKFCSQDRFTTLFFFWPGNKIVKYNGP